MSKQKISKPVSVLVVPVGGEPELVKLEADELAHLQRLVGGYIECQHAPRGLELIVNENGLRRGLPYNRCGFVGTMVFSRLSATGRRLDLRPEHIAKIKDWLARNDQRPPRCHVCGCRAVATMFCPCRNVLLYCGSCYRHSFEVMTGSDEEARRRYCLCQTCRDTGAYKP